MKLKSNFFFKTTIISIVVATLTMGGTMTYAAYTPKKITNKTSEVSIYSSNVPKSAIVYAEKIAPIMLSSVLTSVSDYGVTTKELEHCKLGTPYSIPTVEEDGEITTTEIYYFPIIKNEQVLLMLTVSKTGNDWSASIGKEYSEEIESLDSKETYLLYSEESGIYAQSKKETIALQENNLTGLQLDGEKEETIDTKKEELEEFETLKFKEKKEAIEDETQLELIDPFEIMDETQDLMEEAKEVEGETKLASEKETARDELLGSSEKNVTLKASNGYLINQPDIKDMNMNDCVVNQKDAAGVGRNLCWAACVASIVRYTTGNRSLYAWNVSDTMGVNYDSGANINVMFDALRRYNIQGYQIRSGQLPWNLVGWSIGSQRPIVMTTRATSPQPLGHAVTITGFSHFVKDNLTYRYLKIWNSGNEQYQIMLYSDAGTSFPYANLTWVWQDSIY